METGRLLARGDPEPDWTLLARGDKEATSGASWLNLAYTVISTGGFPCRRQPTARLRIIISTYLPRTVTYLPECGEDLYFYIPRAAGGMPGNPVGPVMRTCRFRGTGTPHLRT